MLAVIQLPLADSRPFVAPKERLPRPSWPLALAGKEFVRSVGQVQERRRGGVAPWSGEEVYADARRAIRLLPQAKASLLPVGDSQARVAFRRMHSDGRAGVRFEIGLVFDTRYVLRRAESVAAVDSAASYPLRIPDGAGWWLGSAAEAGLPLSRLVLGSTSRALDSPAWWLLPGEPLLVFDGHVEEIPKLPTQARAVPTGDTTLRLSWCRVLWQGRLLGAWFIRHDNATDGDAVRRMRIHLLRLHAERETLKHVLRHVAGGLITPDRGTDGAEALQAYLNDASGWLLGATHYGNPQAPMLAAAYGADALIAEGLRTSLLSELRDIRRTIMRKLEQAIAEPEMADDRRILYIDRRTFTMTDNSIKLGNVTGQVGAIGHHAVVRDSFNQIQSSQAGDDMKEALTTLTDQVIELAKRLPAGQTDQVLEDANALVKEATKPTPRKGVVQSFADEILAAAKTVTEFAAPISKIVGTVLALL